MINKFGTKIVGKENYRLAKIRKDLLEKKTGVLVGNVFYYSPEPLPYRWIGNTGMQVFHEGSWKTSELIDFDL